MTEKFLERTLSNRNDRLSKRASTSFKLKIRIASAGALYSSIQAGIFFSICFSTSSTLFMFIPIVAYTHAHRLDIPIQASHLHALGEPCVLRMCMHFNQSGKTAGKNIDGRGPNAATIGIKKGEREKEVESRCKHCILFGTFHKHD